ncbi:MAG: V-type ATP synthase subunit I [Candidatus Peregrinibacteria bacterium]
MALVKLIKIRLTAATPHKEKIMELLQNTGSLDVREIEKNEGFSPETYTDINKLQKTELTHANLEFAINLLSKYGRKKGLLDQPMVMTTDEIEEKTKNFKFQEITDKCSELEEKLAQSQNTLSSLENDLKIYQPWKNLKICLENMSGTQTTSVIAGTIKSTLFGSAIGRIHKISNLISSDVISANKIDTRLIIVIDKELEKEIRQTLSEYKFQEVDLPAKKGLMEDYLNDLKKSAEEAGDKITRTEKELKTLSKNIDNLKIAYEYIGWEKEKFETGKKLGSTDYSFSINAWISKENLKKLEAAIEKETKEFLISEIHPEKGEAPPVVVKNSSFVSPFEAVTRIYGLPKHDEIDPTPFLATYFIIFFALCLTDAGYGIIMFIIMALALKYFKFPDGIKKLVKLLMYGGIVTFLIGALFGGWFGLTPDQVPEFLTYQTASGEKLFLFQKINALTNPIVVLILALSLGFMQLLTGVIIKFIHALKGGDMKSKLEALMDSGTWVFMLSGIGFFILTAAGVLPSSLGVIGKWWVILATVILILTQGREKKGIIAKFFSGILSLYGLVGYMSDILSYSRLLALGLATAIIGLAVNTIVGLTMGLPYINWILVPVIFIFGHIFNLVINALGAFIHSGRLQFVEFFGKFMEGGGDEFRPFSKKTKYVIIKNN